jgi:hypothetical protein
MTTKIKRIRKKKVDPTYPVDQLAEDLPLLRQLKGQIKTISDETSVVNNRAIMTMKENGVRTYTVTQQPGDVSITGTLVEGQSPYLDHDKLKKKIGAKAYNACCSLQIDSAKLEHALTNGDISETDIAECTVLSSRAPYIRLTVK